VGKAGGREASGGVPTIPSGVWNEDGGHGAKSAFADPSIYCGKLACLAKTELAVCRLDQA
jgi:hypothetical protein